jgi:hypothetical protein
MLTVGSAPTELEQAGRSWSSVVVSGCVPARQGGATVYFY